MRSLIICSILISGLLAPSPLPPLSARPAASGTGIDETNFVYRGVARQAFLYLNRFRMQPALYGSRIGLDLRRVRAGGQLHWNTVLAEAAEKKAIDMASENYFGHTDPDGNGMNYRVVQEGYRLPAAWYAGRSSNYIESIAANNYNKDNFINQLILEKNVDGTGHRDHLLGLTAFYRKATEVGIAIVYNRASRYKYYCCVLIAPDFGDFAE